MRKRTIRNLFRRRLPTRPLNSAAGDGKRHGPRVSCDPFGWDQECASSELPNRRNAGAGRGEPAATGSEVYIPGPSVCLDPEGSESVFLYRNPFCHTHCGPAEAAAAPRWGTEWPYKRKKRARKVLNARSHQAANFSHPQIECRIHSKIWPGNQIHSSRYRAIFTT